MGRKKKNGGSGSEEMAIIATAASRVLGGDRRILNERPELVPVSLLRTHPRNARQGDVGAIYQSIAVNGFYGYLVVQKDTGYIICGNHRFMAACSLGYTELPVVWLDVDDEEALRILLADNRTSDLATHDDQKLAAILAELANTTDQKLAGTGYDGRYLDDLIGKIAAAGDITEEPPKKKGQDRLAIVLICEDELEQDSLEDRLKQMGYYPRKTILNERTTLAVG